MTSMVNGGGKHHHSHSHSHNAKEIPETIVGEAGSPKRNILRKGKQPKYRKDEASGKMIEEIIDPYAESILDEDDPCYISDVDDEGVALSATTSKEGDELGKPSIMQP
jgi:hypothetical protein